MLGNHSMGRSVTKAIAGALAAGAIGVLSSSSAEAHFILQAPASWMSQDSSGSPQKMFPCGDEGGGTATGVVTAYQPGQTITVTINETVFHPGHYRIALAVNNRSELPAEPLVTPGATACGTVPVQSPPVFPILADGVFTHTSPFSAPQTVQVKLPSNVTCTNCTLQIMEFMSNHGAPCFYHHCANISIGAAPTDGGAGVDASAGIDASTDVDASAGTDASAGQDSGGAHPDGSTAAVAGGNGSSGGCAVSGRAPSSLIGLAGLVALAGLASRRRQRR